MKIRAATIEEYEKLINRTSFIENFPYKRSPGEIIEKLGEPLFKNNDKTQWEWAIIIEDNGDPHIFSLYDYKEEYIIELSSKYGDWHIGGNINKLPNWREMIEAINNFFKR